MHDRSDDADPDEATCHDPVPRNVTKVLDEHRCDCCHGKAQGDGSA
jgi:hypothetical protein